ncbi:MAG TPA: PAS domain-containing protein [Stellaceae bacterium]|nr:PAS domain-containing protein [Stellaceae bacterium]
MISSNWQQKTETTRAPATVLASALPANADPRLRHLHDYWRSVHPPGGGLPGRQHIDPCDLVPLLRWIWMMDVRRDPLRFRYRLVGTEQVNVMGRDFTGRWLDEAHEQFLSSVSHAQYVTSVERGEIGYLKGSPPYHVTKDFLQVERLLVPLAANGEDVDILLALTIYLQPARFDVV